MKCNVIEMILDSFIQCVEKRFVDDAVDYFQRFDCSGMCEFTYQTSLVTPMASP